MMRSLLVAALVTASAPALAWQDRNPCPVEKGDLVGVVTHIRDTDTIVVSDAAVRLRGVAAPEDEETLYSDAYEAGLDYLERHWKGEAVRCQIVENDRYGRCVGFCSKESRQDLGQAVIERGFARACPRYGGSVYLNAETAASKKLPLPNYCKPRR